MSPCRTCALCDAGAIEIGAGDGQHLARHVDADAAPVERRQQLEQPAGAGAEVEHRLERPLADDPADRRLDRTVGRVQRADLVPAGGIGREIGGRPLLPLALDGAQPFEVALDLRVAVMDARHQRVDEFARGIIVRQPEECPRTFLVAADQPGLEQQLEMPRHARLRLVEDLGEVGDGEVAARQQRQDAQPAGFGGRLQCIYHRVERHMRPGQHSKLQKDINISLCEFRGAVQPLMSRTEKKMAQP